jgi:hypothetical protein
MFAYTLLGFALVETYAMMIWAVSGTITGL